MPYQDLIRLAIQYPILGLVGAVTVAWVLAKLYDGIRPGRRRTDEGDFAPDTTTLVERYVAYGLVALAAVGAFYVSGVV